MREYRGPPATGTSRRRMFNPNAIGVRAHADGVGVKQEKPTGDLRFTPTAFCHIAQGWSHQRPTLGMRSIAISTPKGLRH
jgi:hypothetical protein